MKVNQERLLKLFKDLCLINAPALAERPVVDFVKAHLSALGLDVLEDKAGQKIGGNAGNVIATLKANQPGLPRIFLSAHFDTVEPTAGLIIGEKDGMLFSEGDTILGADDKGGMAPAIEVVQMFLESGEPHGDVVLLFSVAEEIGLKGAEALQIEELGFDFGYVLDTGPPVGTYVNRTGTHDKLDVKIVGKPAHSGKDPEKGINAIQVLAEAVGKMKLGRIGPETTANIGLIAGGTATNVVCAEVRLKAEARSTNVTELDIQVDHMIQTFEEAATQWGATVHIDHKRHYSGFIIDPNAAVVRYAQRASEAVGLPFGLRTTLGGSDANIYNAKGIPTIVVATGMDKIHTHEEEISVESLHQTASLVYQIVRQVAKGEA